MVGSPAQLLVVSPDHTVLRVVQQCALSLGHIPITARDLLQAKRVLSRSQVDLICLDSVLPARETERFWRWVSTATEERCPQLLILAPSSAKLAPASLPAFVQPPRAALVSKPLDGSALARELTRALAERGRRAPEAELLRAGPITLDTDAHQLYFVSGGAVSLTPTEFRLVRYLMGRPGEFIGTDELSEKVWGYAAGTGGADVVRSHINNLRRKLRAAGEDPQVLRNIPYRGYGLVTGQEAASSS